MRVLIVEDEDSIAEPLAVGLEREGLSVVRVATGADALAAAAGVDVVLLDLRLPDIDGYEVCRRLRARSDVPIIMVTARGEEVDRVVGLELGADDYLVKPFGFRELLARIRAVTRRASRTGDPAGPTEPATLRVGPLEIDVRARRVRMGGAAVELTPKEFDLLAALAADAGAVVSRRRLLEEVWETSWGGASKTIDVHVASVRRKVGDAGLIETIRGVGFRLRVDP
jgi:DNA-binding response OmpR family regulator